MKKHCLHGVIIGVVFGAAGGMFVGGCVAGVLVVNGQGDEAFHAIMSCTTKGITGGFLAGITSAL